MGQGLSRRQWLKAMGAGAGLMLGYPPLAAIAGPLIGSDHPATPAIKRGGILRAAFAGSSNDSTNVLTATSSTIGYVRARLIWDTLADINNNQIEWRLMESAEPNNDATRWTIRLRRGVTFSNGQRLTAKDVLFSLQSLASHPGSQSGWLTPLDTAASRIEDDFTLTLQLRRPLGTFDWLLAQSMFIFPADTTDFATALGSGPYALKNWSSERSLLLSRQDYWDSDHGGPYLDEIQLFAVNDMAARLNGLKAGQFDYVGGVALLTARTEQHNAALKLWIADPSQWGELAFSMNLSMAPFNQASVVEALKLSIDRQTMVRAVTQGMGTVANDVIGAGQYWSATDLPQRKYDPDRARDLLRKAGLSEVQALIRTSDYEYGLAESATLLLRQAKAGGFSLGLNKIPAMDYFSDISTLLHTPLQTNLYRPMPLPVALPFYYGSGAPYPFTGPASPTLDKLMQSMQAARGETLRQKIQDVQQWLYQHGGDAIFARLPSVAASLPHVEGVQADGFFDYPQLRNAWKRERNPAA